MEGQEDDDLGEGEQDEQAFLGFEEEGDAEAVEEEEEDEDDGDHDIEEEEAAEAEKVTEESEELVDSKVKNLVGEYDGKGKIQRGTAQGKEEQEKFDKKAEAVKEQKNEMNDYL